MIKILGSAIIAAVFVCGCVQAQSLLLQPEQAGPFIQAAYLTTLASYDNANGGEFHVGYAFSRTIDLGLSVSSSSASTKTWGGQFLDLYPLRTKGDGTGVALGLHESYTTALDGSEAGPIFTGGASLNFIVRSEASAGVALSAGYERAEESGRSGQDIGIGQLCAFWSGDGIGPGGFFFQYGVTEGPDMLAAGLTFSISK